MDRFPEKLREARKNAELNQTQLGAMIGISQRSMTNYERGIAIPRRSTVRKLARALGVTTEYLVNDEVTDPHANEAQEARIESARDRFGTRGAKEMQDLLDRNVALFAGGEISEEQKDAFMEALSAAYFACKAKAHEKFTPKSLREKPETGT